MDLANSVSDSYLLHVLAARAAKDMCLARGEDWDGDVLWVGKYLVEAALTQAVMSDPMPDIPFPVIADVCSMPELRNLPNVKEFSRLFSESLRLILKAEGRKGRRSAYLPSRSMRRERVLLFDGFAYYGSAQYAEVRMLSLRDGGIWSELLQGIAANVVMNFRNNMEVPWEKVLLLDEEHADLVGCAVKGTDPFTDPREDEGPSMVWDAFPADQMTGPDEYPIDPVVLEDPDASLRTPRQSTLLKDMARHARDTGRRGMPYVPSGHLFMTYDRMSPDQMEFYLSWRSEVVGGEFRDTDQGYLWLLLCELVQDDRDAEVRLRVLDSLLRMYGGCSEQTTEMIGRACTDYAFLTDQDPPWYPGYLGRHALAILSMKLLADVPRRIHMDLLTAAMPKLDVEGHIYSDLDYDDALNAAIGALDRYIGSHGGGCLRDRMMRTHTRRSREMFPRMVHGWQRYVPQDLLNTGKESSAFRLLRAAARVAVRGVNSMNGVRRPRRPQDLDEGMLRAMEDAVGDLVAEASRRSREERIRREAMSIVLDMDAVRGAEEDLMAVAELVGVEDADPVPEEEPQEAATATREAEGPSSPWEMLARSLDDAEMGYLRACLRGTGRGFLRDAGVSMVLMEDSVNRKAMDAVGDQVVESGEVFEDYAEELSTVL